MSTLVRGISSRLNSVPIKYCTRALPNKHSDITGATEMNGIIYYELILRPTWVFAKRPRLGYQTVLAAVSQTTGSAPVLADACASCLVSGVFLFPPHDEGCANERRTLTF